MDEDLCASCSHARDEHKDYGDEYDYDWYECLVEGCHCRQFLDWDDD